MAWAIYWTTLGVVVGACLFAILKGDRPERYGACLRFVVAIVGMVASHSLKVLGLPSNQWSPIVDLAATAAMSFGFLYIAIRYASNWLAVAMIIQGLQFYTDRVFLDNDVQNGFSFSMQENMITIGVALTLVAATVKSIVGRRRRRIAEADRARKNLDRLARMEALISDRGLAPA